MKNVIAAVIMICLTAGMTGLNAQKKEGDVTDIAKITFLVPGLSYEKRIGKLQTLHANALLNISSSATGSYYGSETRYYSDPSFLLEYRYYCNYKRRNRLSKATDRNSMNYVAALAQIIFSKLPVGEKSYENSERRPVYVFGAMYGLQRNYKSRFSLDLNFGVGAMFARSRYAAGGLL